MHITDLKMEYGNNGQTIVKVWATCYTPADCSQMIAWLKLGEANMHHWKAISETAAKADKKSEDG